MRVRRRRVHLGPVHGDRVGRIIDGELAHAGLMLRDLTDRRGDRALLHHGRRRLRLAHRPDRRLRHRF